MELTRVNVEFIDRMRAKTRLKKRIDAGPSNTWPTSR